MKDIRNGDSGKALPSRSKTRPTLSRFRWRGKRQEIEHTAGELAFLEAVHALEEGAAATMLGEPLPEEPKRWWKKKRWLLLALLLLLLLLGGGVWWWWRGLAAVTLPVTPPKAAAPAQKVVLPVRQTIRWSELQVQNLKREERDEIEQKLSSVVASAPFQTATFNFLFASNLNQFSKGGNSGLIVSGFFHNGLLKDVKPEKIKVTAMLDDKVILDRTFNGPFGIWEPGDIHLLTLIFDKEDVHNETDIGRLLKDTNLQRFLRFHVSMAYEQNNDYRHAGDEGSWIFLNTQTLQVK